MQGGHRLEVMRLTPKASTIPCLLIPLCSQCIVTVFHHMSPCLIDTNGWLRNSETSDVRCYNKESHREGGILSGIIPLQHSPMSPTTSSHRVGRISSTSTRQSNWTCVVSLLVRVFIAFTKIYRPTICTIIQLEQTRKTGQTFCGFTQTSPNQLNQFRPSTSSRGLTLATSRYPKNPSYQQNTLIVSYACYKGGGVQTLKPSHICSH